MVIYVERGADLHMAQLMPLPLTVSCFSKIQIGFTFLVPAHPGSPGKRAIKRVCVCVLMLLLAPSQQCQGTEGQHALCISDAFWLLSCLLLIYLWLKFLSHY